MTLMGMPGPGGSLGQCAVCGDSFVQEVLLNEPVKTIGMEAFKEELCVHQKCIESLEHARDNGRETLPDGPIRKAYSEMAAKLESSPVDGQSGG